MFKARFIARGTTTRGLLVDRAWGSDEGATWFCLDGWGLVVVLRKWQIMLRWRGIETVLRWLHILNHGCGFHRLSQFLDLMLNLSFADIRVPMVNRWLLPMMCLSCQVFVRSSIIHSCALKLVPTLSSVRGWITLPYRDTILCLIRVKVSILRESASRTLQSCFMINYCLTLLLRDFRRLQSLLWTCGNKGASFVFDVNVFIVKILKTVSELLGRLLFLLTLITLRNLTIFIWICIELQGEDRYLFKWLRIYLFIFS